MVDSFYNYLDLKHKEKSQKVTFSFLLIQGDKIS